MLDQIKALYAELHAELAPKPPATMQKTSDSVNHNASLPEALPQEHVNTWKFTYCEKPEPGVLKPYEKLKAHGIQSLSNLELFCLLLDSGNRKQSVEQLAAKVLPLLLRQPFATDLKSLQNIKGMDFRKSASILAAMEIAKRFPNPETKRLDNPKAIYKQIAHFADQQENLVALNLNGACEALSIRLITRGTVNRSLIHPREVFTHAVREQAHSIVIAHNHPTGHLQPSKEDLQSTQHLQEAANILGIKLLDHIIFSEAAYLSLAEQGLL